MALLRADLDTAVQADLVSLNRPSILQRYYRHRYLFALMAAALVWTIVFKYGPMYGIIIAFKRYRFFDGIWGSSWVGLDHFVRLFNGTTDFGRVFRNTLLISLYRLFWGFPAPIILALLLNEVRQRQFKRTVQTISYLPHFLSWVVLGGVIRSILSPSTGVINLIITGLGGERIHFLADINWFVTVLITTRRVAAGGVGVNHLSGRHRRGGPATSRVGDRRRRRQDPAGVEHHDPVHHPGDHHHVHPARG